MSNQKDYPPARIWLQAYDEDGEPLPREHWDALTWCEDKINDTDIEYVRVDRRRKAKP